MPSWRSTSSKHRHKALPFEPGTFDVVLSTLVLHQLPPADLHAAVGRDDPRACGPAAVCLLVDIGGEGGHGGTVHAQRRASGMACICFDLRDVATELGSFGLTTVASGEVPFRLADFEQIYYVLATRDD